MHEMRFGSLKVINCKNNTKQMQNTTTKARTNAKCKARPKNQGMIKVRFQKMQKERVLLYFYSAAFLMNFYFRSYFPGILVHSCSMPMILCLKLEIVWIAVVRNCSSHFHKIFFEGKMSLKGRSAPWHIITQFSSKRHHCYLKVKCYVTMHRFKERPCPQVQGTLSSSAAPT